KNTTLRELDLTSGDHKEDGNDSGGNNKYGGKRKPLNGKLKPNNKFEGLVKYFLCNGLYMVRDYPCNTQYWRDLSLGE
ncbi:hypothetical protein J1N35_040773, partial [Gossypium stocksii]